jgi:hypothetical protein
MNTYESDASPYILFDVCEIGDVTEEIIDMAVELNRDDDNYYSPTLDTVN